MPKIIRVVGLIGQWSKGSGSIGSCYNQGSCYSLGATGGLIGMSDKEVSSISVSNCYNTGNYSLSGQGYYSPIVATGYNCSFSSTVGSLDFGWNPNITNVTYSPGFVSSQDMKNAASKLGSNFKSASGSENRRISIVNLAIVVYLM